MQVAPAPPALETPPSQQEDYRMLEERIGALTDHYAKLAGAYDLWDEPTRNTIRDLEDAYRDTYLEAYEHGQPYPSFSAFTRSSKRVPDAVLHVLEATEAVEAELETSRQALEAHAPEKAADILQQAAALEASIDYDATASRIDNLHFNELHAGVSFVIAARKLLEAGEPFTYAQLQVVERRLREYSDQWNNEGLLQAASDETSVVEADDMAANFSPDEVQRLQDRFDTARRFHDTYKPLDVHFGDRPRQILDMAERLASSDDNPTTEELILTRVTSYNTAYKSALNRVIRRKIAELPAADFESNTQSEAYRQLLDAARTIDPEQAFNDLEITGSLEELPIPFSEAELRELLIDNMPPLAIAATKRIEFRALSHEEDPEGDTLGRQRYDEGLGGSIVAINTKLLSQNHQKMKKYAAAEGIADNIVEDVIRDELLWTIAHEIAHSLHNVLPFGALKQWADAIARDPTRITSYVKRMHDEDHHNTGKEEFADGLAFFVRSPHVLRVISAQRFYAMTDLYEALTPNYRTSLGQRQAEHIMRQMAVSIVLGESEKDIRKEYLTHEQPDS